MSQQLQNNILEALLDSFNQPMWIIDVSGKLLMMNEAAKDYANKGFNILSRFNPTKCEHLKFVSFLGKKYIIESKDINHGTNCFVVSLEEHQNSLVALKESTSRLKKVLSSV
jgi:transcriptional regulator of aromatic amino acid metabolism